MNDRDWIRQGHNVLVSAVGFYGQAVAELTFELDKASAARTEASQLRVAAEQQRAAAEIERDDLRAEICKLRVQLTALQANSKATEEVRDVVQNELQGWRERCSRLERLSSDLRGALELPTMGKREHAALIAEERFGHD